MCGTPGSSRSSRNCAPPRAETARLTAPGQSGSVGTRTLSMTNGSKISGFPPATDVDTGVIPIRPSGRGMLQLAVDESRRSAALKAPIKASAESLGFYYGQFQALKDLNIEIREKQVTALI